MFDYYSEREEEAALDQARQAHIAREQLSDFDKQKAKRDKERLKEQEKRRRMAVSKHWNHEVKTM